MKVLVLVPLFAITAIKIQVIGGGNVNLPPLDCQNRGFVTAGIDNLGEILLRIYLHGFYKKDGRHQGAAG